MRGRLEDSSLQSVTEWAKNNFQNNFSKIPTKKDLNVQRFRLADFRNNAQFKCIVVGHASERDRAGHAAVIDVLAWYVGRRVVTGYIPHCGDKLQPVVHEDIVKGNINFNRPFSWVVRAGAETAAQQLEAIIRYAFLLSGSPTALHGRGQLTKFEKYFPGACRSIANVRTTRRTVRQLVTLPLPANDPTPVEETESSEKNPPETVHSDDAIVMLEPSPADSEAGVTNAGGPVELPAQEPVIADASHHASSANTRIIELSLHLSDSMNLRDGSHEISTPQRRITRSQAASQEPDTAASLSPEPTHQDDSAISATTTRLPLQDCPLQVQLERMSGDYKKFKNSLFAGLKANQANTIRLENELINLDNEKIRAQEEIEASEGRNALLNTVVEHQRNEVEEWRGKNGVLEAEVEKQRLEIISLKLQHALVKTELEKQREEVACWKARQGVAEEQTKQAREAAETWEAKYEALKTSLSDVLNAQI